MEQQKKCKGLVYQVKNGDTLYKISKIYGMKVRDLMMANPYINVYDLQPGDELCVPVFAMPQGYRPYCVGKNENLNNVLKKTNLTYEELVKINKKIGELPIKEGTVLLIPQKNGKNEEKNEQNVNKN